MASLKEVRQEELDGDLEEGDVEPLTLDEWLVGQVDITKRGKEQQIVTKMGVNPVC